MKEYEINEITIVNPRPDELEQIIMAQARKPGANLLLFSWTKRNGELAKMRDAVPSQVAARGEGALNELVKEAKGATLVTVLRASS